MPFQKIYWSQFRSLTRHQPWNVERFANDLIFPGDPIIIQLNHKVHVAVILKLFTGNNQIQNMHVSEVSDPFTFTTKLIALIEIDENFSGMGHSKTPRILMSLLPTVCLFKLKCVWIIPKNVKILFWQIADNEFTHSPQSFYIGLWISLISITQMWNLQ